MKEITKEQLARFSSAFHADRANLIAANAAGANGVAGCAKNAAAVNKLQHAFSVCLPQKKVTNQRHSGRCWIFAACNLFRAGMMERWNLENFELSQTYLFFWDKLERAGFFLENMIKTAHLPTDDRLFQFLNQDPVQDGGQWDLLMNLVEKYGVMPVEAYPDNANAKASGAFRGYLTSILRQDALRLRTLVKQGVSAETLSAEKDAMLEEVYRLLCISLGEPPRTFDFAVYDKDGNLLREDGITPGAFYEKYIGLHASDYVSLINAPTADKPYNRTFTVEYLGNVVGGRGVTYLNVPMDVIRDCLVRQLKSGEPVWFGSDCGKFAQGDAGVFDRESLAVETLLNVRFTLDKGERLSLYDSLPNHAMLIQGVHLDRNEKPVRWRIENSWGEDRGKDGFYVASDSWLGEYAYQFVIRKSLLPDELLVCLEQDPIILPAWDPMGTLAD